MNQLIIRQETPADHYAVEELTREAFWNTFWDKGQQICDEPLLVSKLRKSEAFVPELNLVAELDGAIVGHIIYSISKIVCDDGTTHKTLTFGPLSVHPSCQGNGIGAALMRHSFDIARDMGHRAVIIFGHPNYYPRVGFRPAAEFGITTADGGNFDAFMALPLYEGALDGICGKYYLDAVYEQLTQEEALEFDKKFPPKAFHTPAGIDVLLDRLEPVARAAVESLGFHTVALFKTRSLREISALEGIDEKAIDTIRKVLQENGIVWDEGRTHGH